MELIEIEIKEQKLKSLKDKCSDIILLDTVDSTNTYAKDLCYDKAGHKTVIIASNQTAGRGRQGKSFYSCQNGGLYMSVILSAEKVREKIAQLLTISTAVAVCKGIERISGEKAGIKWVNDIFIGGKKVCGILCESVINKETLEPAYYIVGIGVNVKQNDFPEEIKNIAGSVQCSKDKIDQLAGEILKYLFEILENFDERNIINEYRSKMIMLGRNINFKMNGKTYSAVAQDINLEGHLLADCNGKIITLASGEITLGSENFSK